MASTFLTDLQAGASAGTMFFANRELSEEAFSIRESFAETPEDSVTSVGQTLDGLAGAVVRQATFTVTARAPGTASIRSVAQVRAAAGSPEDAANELIIDFQGLRTVSRVTAPALMRQILPWLGAQYGESIADSRGAGVLEFRETLAERLLVGFTGAVDPADLAGGGSVTIPTPPADLELIVNGVRAWFNAGPARPAAPQAGEEDATPEFRADVDLTAPIRAAVETGAVPIQVELRSSIPGRLGLAARLDTLETHTVVFPEGNRAIEATEEGALTLAVPLPAEASAWMIHAVEATISGSLGATRVLRPDGPSLSTTAELVLDVDHSAVVRLPGNAVAQLAKLTALRLPVLAGVDGAEVSGTLLADLDSEPGEAVTDGQLGPVQIAAGPEDRLVWITLPFVPTRDPEPLWVSVQVARGSVRWPLAEPAGEASDPGLDALLRRRAANGRFKPLSHVEGVATGAAAVRVAGEPPPNAPIAPAEIRVAGEAEAVPFTPSSGGVTVSLRLAAPVQTDALRLELLTWTPGTFSFRDVLIAYTEPEGDS